MKKKWIIILLTMAIFVFMPYEKAVPIQSFSISPMSALSDWASSSVPSFISNNVFVFLLGIILIGFVYLKVKD